MQEKEKRSSTNKKRKCWKSLTSSPAAMTCKHCETITYCKLLRSAQKLQSKPMLSRTSPCTHAAAFPVRLQCINQALVWQRGGQLCVCFTYSFSQRIAERVAVRVAVTCWLTEIGLALATTLVQVQLTPLLMCGRPFVFPLSTSLSMTDSESLKRQREQMSCFPQQHHLSFPPLRCHFVFSPALFTFSRYIRPRLLLTASCTDPAAFK